MDWNTSCPDWERKLIAGESIIPCGPLFPAEARAAMRIFSELIMVDVPGSPMIKDVSRDWVMDFASVIFGSYDHETRERLIKSYLLLVSKKNGKSSPIASGIMLTMLLRNWRHSAEFIIIAPTVEIANNSFGPAKDMIYADEQLSTLLIVQPHYRKIIHRVTKAELKVIAADSEAVSGKKATGVLVEELWLFGKRANAESMLMEATGGLTSRPEGFEIYISTQSDEPPAGVFDQKLIEFRKIRDGEIVDKQSLPVIFEHPKAMLKDGSFRNPDNFYITNPNLGASVSKDWLVRRYQQAERNGEGSFRIFAAKHLNVEIGGAIRSDGWAGAEFWDYGVDPLVTLEYILDNCDVVTVGIDGGGLDDLLGFSAIGREKITKKWLCWTHAYISPQGETRRKINTTIYNQFIQDDDLTRVEQLPDDLAAIVLLVKRIKDAGLLARVGVDAIGIGGIVDSLEEIDVTEGNGLLVSIRQGIALMGAIKTVERKLVDGTFKHSGSRMMNWCVGNAKIVNTPTAMRLARDDTGAGKIDPLAAVFNAAELMMSNPLVKDKRRQMLFFGSKSMAMTRESR